MKKVITIIVTALLCGILAFNVGAHSGGTDSKGGHYDKSKGEYHYHQAMKHIIIMTEFAL